MLNLKQAEVVKDWKSQGIITELSLDEVFSMNDQPSTNVGCGDGRQDFCCHWREKCGGHPENDSIRYYGGPAIFAASYRGFNKERAIIERAELIEGMLQRGIVISKRFWHLPCGKLNFFRHTLEDIILLAQESDAFLQEKMPKDFEVHTYLHIRKERRGGGQLQRTYNFHPDFR
jgi:hypothetical protein